jgi:hypothetical protein
MEVFGPLETECPKCQSTEAVRTHGTVTTIPGLHRGMEYDRIDRHWLQCQSCGQFRIDAVYTLNGFLIVTPDNEAAAMRSHAEKRLQPSDAEAFDPAERFGRDVDDEIERLNAETLAAELPPTEAATHFAELTAAGFEPAFVAEPASDPIEMPDVSTLEDEPPPPDPRAPLTTFPMKRKGRRK